MLRILWRLGNVFVYGHGKGAGRVVTVPRLESSENGAKLPARLRHTGNHTGGGEFAEGDPGEAEAAQESAATSGYLTTVHKTGRAGIAWQHRQANIVFFLLQLATEVGILVYRLLFAFVAGDPTFLSHNFGGRGDTGSLRQRKPKLKLFPISSRI